MSYGPDPDSVAEAIKARSADPPESLKSIARRLGVSDSTIVRWTNPEKAERGRRKSREAKRRLGTAHLTATSRRYRDARKRPCSNCPNKIDPEENKTGLCEECREAKTLEKHLMVAEMWRDGATRKEISRATGYSRKSLNPIMAEMRKKPEKYGELPYRYMALRDPEGATELRMKICALWNEGLTGPEVAEKLSLSMGQIVGHFTAIRSYPEKYGEMERRVLGGEELELRRSKVVELWNEDKTMREIADILKVPFHLVVNDISWMRARPERYGPVKYRRTKRRKQ